MLWKLETDLVPFTRELCFNSGNMSLPLSNHVQLWMVPWTQPSKGTVPINVMYWELAKVLYTTWYISVRCPALQQYSNASIQANVYGCWLLTICHIHLYSIWWNKIIHSQLTDIFNHLKMLQYYCAPSVSAVSIWGCVTCILRESVIFYAF